MKGTAQGHGHPLGTTCRHESQATLHRGTPPVPYKNPTLPQKQHLHLSELKRFFSLIKGFYTFQWGWE